MVEIITCQCCGILDFEWCVCTDLAAIKPSMLGSVTTTPSPHIICFRFFKALTFLYRASLLLRHVQITECEDGSLQFKVDAPGLAKDDFKIEVSPDNVLTISGEVS